MKTKLFLMAAACGVVLSLGACSKSAPNPLKTVDSEHTGTFLVRASIYGEDKLNMPENRHRQAFLRCMQGIETSSTCNKLYVYMVEYAKKDPDFRSLTVSDLKELKGSPEWREIRKNYNEYGM